VTLLGPAFTALQPSRVVVGLLKRAIPMRYGGRVRTFGIRLHPARAAHFLGVAATHLANTLTPLSQLSPTCDARLVQWLEGNPDLESATDRSSLESLMNEQRRQSAGVDRLVVRAVDRLLSAEHPMTVVGLARELGVTSRHLHRRFVATVGSAPKRLERLARFARTWQTATMGPSATWTELAHANGYADQAHLIREFRSFGANPPTHLFTAEWYDATTVQRANTPKDDVRFVQGQRNTRGPRSNPHAGSHTAPANRRKSR
jgi:AraC-like DNA-binding protein